MEQPFKNDEQFFKSVDFDVERNVLFKAQGSHKYIKRTGTPGKYRYWYKNVEGKLVADKKPEEGKINQEKQATPESKEQKPTQSITDTIGQLKSKVTEKKLVGDKEYKDMNWKEKAQYDAQVDKAAKNRWEEKNKENSSDIDIIDSSLRKYISKKMAYEEDPDQTNEYAQKISNWARKAEKEYGVDAKHAAEVIARSINSHEAHITDYGEEDVKGMLKEEFGKGKKGE